MEITLVHTILISPSLLIFTLYQKERKRDEHCTYNYLVNIGYFYVHIATLGIGAANFALNGTYSTERPSINEVSFLVAQI